MSWFNGWVVRNAVGQGSTQTLVAVKCIMRRHSTSSLTSSLATCHRTNHQFWLSQAYKQQRQKRMRWGNDSEPNIDGFAHLVHCQLNCNCFKNENSALTRSLTAVSNSASVSTRSDFSRLRGVFDPSSAVCGGTRHAAVHKA